MKTYPYVNDWKQCSPCGDVHRNDDRVWIKYYGLDTSSCPRCGSVLIAPEAAMQRQMNLLEGAIA